MSEYIKASIAYKSENDQAKWVIKKENILIEAISFSEAELIAYQLFLDEINPVRMPKEWQKSERINDFKIVNLAPEQVEETLIGDGDVDGENLAYWFRGKVQLTHDSGKSTIYFYVSGMDFLSATKTLNENLKKNYFAVDWKIQSIILTNVTGIYKYDEEIADRAVKTNEERLKEIEESAKCCGSK